MSPTPVTDASRTAAAPVNLYTSPEFLEVVAKVYFPDESCRAQDVVAGGQVFRLLSVEGRGPVLDQPFVDLHEPVARAARSTRLPSLPRLPMASQELVPVEEFRRDPGWEASLGAPAVLWQDFPSWGDYLQVLRSRRVIQEDQRRRRRLEGLLGPITFTLDDTADDVLPACYAWKSARDQELARSDLFASAANRRFFPALRSRGLLRVSTLRAGDRLLAIWLGAVYQQRWSGWVFACDPDPALSRFSLDRQLLYPMLEESHRARHREFDFPIGLDGDKLHFATHVRRLGPLGAAGVSERASAALKTLLRQTPWLHEKASALRRWLGGARRAHGASRKHW